MIGVPGALGALETSSIGLGIEAADAMLKRAGVNLVISRPICPGKYLAVVAGSVEDVGQSLEAGLLVAGDSCVDKVLLTNPHPSLFRALTATTDMSGLGALGIVECYTMCCGLESADVAVKRAQVSLIEVRLSIMLAGKSFLTFTGDESAVREAVNRAAETARSRGLLLSAVVIPRPREELVEFLL